MPQIPSSHSRPVTKVPDDVRHAGHEMRCFLQVHTLLHRAKAKSQDPFADFPVVWDALRTAYATHVRNLLEFFREGTPNKPARDITYSSVSSSNPYRVAKWPPNDKALWEQASQLAAHLSGKRPDYGELPEWEDRGCEKILVPMIKDAVERLPGVGEGVRGALEAVGVLEASRLPQPTSRE